MTVNVFYLAQLGKVTGVTQESMALPESTNVQDFIRQQLCQKHSGLSKAILDEAGALLSVLLVFVSDEQIALDDPYPLKTGDDAAPMQLIAGS